MFVYRFDMPHSQVPVALVILAGTSSQKSEIFEEGTVLGVASVVMVGSNGIFDVYVSELEVCVLLKVG